jgi:hypothetical protein
MGNSLRHDGKHMPGRGRPPAVTMPDAAPMSVRHFSTALRKRIARYAIDTDSTMEAVLNEAVRIGMEQLEQTARE